MKHAFPHPRTKRLLLLSATLATLGLQACRGGDRDAIEPCKGMCLPNGTDDIPKTKEACKAAEGSDDQLLWEDGNCLFGNQYVEGVEQEACEKTGIWKDDKCLLGNQYVEGIEQEACETMHGHWSAGECKIIDKATCNKKMGNWVDIQLYDMEDGRYIHIDPEHQTYTCGTYEEIRSGKAKPCEHIDSYLKDINHGLCNATTYCRAITMYDEDGNRGEKVPACTSCPEDMIRCGHECTNINKDDYNCGKCGHACDSNMKEFCKDGKCKTFECEYERCQLPDGDYKCVDLDSDNDDFCGSCYNPCNKETERCINKECVPKKCVDNCSKEAILKAGMEIPDFEDIFEDIFGNITSVCLEPSDFTMCGINSCDKLFDALQKKENIGCKGELICQKNDDESYACSCPEKSFAHGDLCLRPSDNRSCGATESDPGQDCTLETGYCDPETHECSLCVGGRVLCEKDGQKRCIDPTNSTDFCGANLQCQNYLVCNGEESKCDNGLCVCGEGYAACGDDNQKCLELTDSKTKQNHCGAKSAGQCNSDDPNSEDFKGKNCGDPNTAICIEKSKTETYCGCPTGKGSHYLSCDGQCINVRNSMEYCGAENCKDKRGENCHDIVIIGDLKVECQYALNNTNCACIGGTIVEDYPGYEGTKVCVNTREDPKCCAPAGATSCQQGQNCIDKNNDSENYVCLTGDCEKATCPENEIYCTDRCVQNRGKNCDTCAEGYCPVGDPVEDCVKPETNEHCGACGDVCKNGFVCRHHVSPSSDSYICDCVFPSSNGITCKYNDETYCAEGLPEHMEVVEGTCQCENWYADGDGDFMNGCEIDLRTDVQHCGELNHSCLDMKHVVNPQCILGKCQYDRCESSYGDCNEDILGCETNLAQSEACGMCTRSCNNGRICHQELYECCYESDKPYDHPLDVCCHPDAKVWQQCVGPWCNFYKKNWRCSIEKPDGNWIEL